MRMITINESLWLSHKYILGKMALKKGVVHIKFMKQLTTSNRKIENKTNVGGLDNWIERVMIINSRTLMKPFGN